MLCSSLIALALAGFTAAAPLPETRQINKPPVIPGQPQFTDLFGTAIAREPQVPDFNEPTLLGPLMPSPFVGVDRLSANRRRQIFSRQGTFPGNEGVTIGTPPKNFPIVPVDGLISNRQVDAAPVVPDVSTLPAFADPPLAPKFPLTGVDRFISNRQVAAAPGIPSFTDAPLAPKFPIVPVDGLISNRQVDAAPVVPDVSTLPAFADAPLAPKFPLTGVDRFISNRQVDAAPVVPEAPGIPSFADAPLAPKFPLTGVDRFISNRQVDAAPAVPEVFPELPAPGPARFPISPVDRLIVNRQNLADVLNGIQPGPVVDPVVQDRPLTNPILPVDRLASN